MSRRTIHYVPIVAPLGPYVYPFYAVSNSLATILCTFSVQDAVAFLQKLVREYPPAGYGSPDDFLAANAPSAIAGPAGHVIGHGYCYRGENEHWRCFYITKIEPGRGLSSFTPPAVVPSGTGTQSYSGTASSCPSASLGSATVQRPTHTVRPQRTMCVFGQDSGFRPPHASASQETKLHLRDDGGPSAVSPNPATDRPSADSEASSGGSREPHEDDNDSDDSDEFEIIMDKPL